MEQNLIQILLMLSFYPKIPSAAEIRTVEKGQDVEIKCGQPKGTIVFWFRVLNGSDMEFLGSVSPSGVLKWSEPNFNGNFDGKSSDGYRLTVKDFDKTEDSGMYTCASLEGGNKLTFGNLFKLQEKYSAPKKTTKSQVPTTRTTSAIPLTCRCEDKKKSTGPFLDCSLIILGPLAGGCGFLLLLLIVTILYCNKTRTRRCPHHYKRKLRTMAPQKEMMSNRYI